MLIEKIHFNPEFHLLPEQKEILKNIIEWKDPPPVVKTGRSTFLVIENENSPFVGLKIKGCGYFNLFKNESVPPSDTNEYDPHIINAADGVKEMHYQIDVNEKNELIYSIPGKHPFGGQIYKKAKLEFDANSELLKNWQGDIKDFPFYLPVGWAEYKDLVYQKNNLGVTMLGSPVRSEIPLSAYFEGNFEENGLRINPHILDYWRNCCAPLGKTTPDFFDLLSAIKKLCFEFGRSLRDLHDYYADFDGHFFNATVNPDTGRVILFDFDHVIHINDMPAQKYFYYSLKDFELGFTGILSNFLMSGLAHGIILFEETGHPVDDYNPVEAYFEGYFGRISEETKNHARTIWDSMLMLIMNKIIHSDKHQIFRLVHEFCEMHRDKSYADMFDEFAPKVSGRFNDFSLSKENHKKIVDAFLKSRNNVTAGHNM